MHSLFSTAISRKKFLLILVTTAVSFFSSLSVLQWVFPTQIQIMPGTYGYSSYGANKFN